MPWAKQYEQELKGKILFDITNPFNETHDDFMIGFGTGEIQELIREQ